MAKFCTKCGASLEDNASFCTSCGAKFEAEPVAQAVIEQPQANETILDKFKANANAEGIKKLTANPNFTKYAGIGAVALVVLILIIILCSVFSGGYAKPVEKMYKAVQNKDGDLMMECYSEYEIDYMADRYDMSKKDIQKYYKESAKTLYDFIKEEYGRDFKIKVSVEDKEKIDKDDLKDIEEILQIKFDKKKLEVTKGYVLDCDFEIKGDDDEDTESEEVLVLKIDGEWCITSLLDADDDFGDILEDLEDDD